MGKPVPRATVKTQRPTATAKKVSGGPAVPKGSAADRGAERSAADDDGKRSACAGDVESSAGATTAEGPSRRDRSQRANVFAPLARLPFLLAVALVAAALGDTVVETIANSGILGAGFADDNHASVVPTLLLGGVLALEVARRRCAEMLRRGAGGVRTDWVIELARRYTPGSLPRDLTIVFALQLFAVFLMENAEQLAFGGKLLGGTAWLGGPIVFSLLAHALIGAGCTFLLARLVRSILATVANILRCALDYILIEIARASGRFASGRREEAPHRRAGATLARQFGDRAPPFRSLVLT